MDPVPGDQLPVYEVLVGLPEDDIINGPDTYPVITMGQPWEYNGWKIWKWTGWKGNWYRRSPHSTTLICSSCLKPLEKWDIIYVAYNLCGMWHAECSPQYTGEIYGQWLALDKLVQYGEPGHHDVRHAYASVPGGEGLYQIGAYFDIMGGPRLTYYTDPEELEAAKWEGLERLKAVIDQEVNRVVA